VSAVRIDHDEILSSRAAQAEAFARELEQRAAVKLFERGELTAGEAARLAGMGRVEFALALRRHQVSPARLSSVEVHQDRLLES
jgi:predicted HTH domain antitoxin